MTLLEAKFVPCVHMHFKWLEESAQPKYLKEEIYTKKTSSDAASILASKYRYVLIIIWLFNYYVHTFYALIYKCWQCQKSTVLYHTIWTD